jgi:hypothetical protein
MHDFYPCGGAEYSDFDEVSVSGADVGDCFLGLVLGGLRGHRREVAYEQFASLE